MDLANNQDELTAAYFENSVMIRISGRGSFKTSSPLKQFIHHVIDDTSIKKIIVDMTNCVGMDSTFMGIIAGLSCYMKKKANIEQFKLINLSKKNEKLFITLGVNQVIDYSLFSASTQESAVSSLQKEETLVLVDQDKLEMAKTSLEAHTALMKMSQENEKKFRAVVEYLQEDVDKLDS
jgi:anti-anti-sigma regulatory factor